MSEDTKMRLRFTADGSVLMRDGLRNVVSGMGTDRDMRSFSKFAYGIYQDFAELEAAYSENWIARQVIDVPVDDATREWRSFSCKEAQEIQREEKRLNLQGVTQEAFKWAGLYGGAGVLMITDQPLDAPLDVTKIKKGSLKRLMVLDRMLLAGQRYNVTDPLSPNYMLPEVYRVAGGVQEIHHSHFVRAPGAKLPLRIRMINGGWDDSQLRRCMEDIKDAVAAKGGIASLIQEANVDIIQKEGLAEALGSGDMDGQVAERYRLFGMMKSLFRLGLLDSSEEYHRHPASFGGLGEVLRSLMEWVSGAAEIPMTRLFGVQSKGIGDSGEGDSRNYYSAIGGRQEADYRPFLERIDEVLIRSALGNMPDDCEFEFNPLSQPSDTELAQQELGFANADDVRLQQGVVRRSQIMRKLQSQGVYAISDEEIEAQAALEREPIGANEPDLDLDFDLPDAAGAAASADPDESLNGAQVTAMLEIVARVREGQITRGTAAKLIAASFPLSIDQAEDIVSEVREGVALPEEGNVTGSPDGSE
ncbi:DUF1073 domain-containing protein [Billgrantia tianxiuensis]|uniref:DUF1073 domain-containing protein n=2 Tax=Oceanospirillales TaxID=135619 RepID=A0A6I6SU22_9GAMM|nr:DUF1073 domain-containing protein [Halomonas sp. MCCC 1A11057]QHC50473.1 DUF1073 domain-containing protein [Halomonas tianxiuensis]